jgi:hypothetical protein
MLNKLKNWKWAALPMLLMGIAVALFAFKPNANTFTIEKGNGVSLKCDVETITSTAYENAGGTTYANMGETVFSEHKMIDLQVSGSNVQMTIQNLTPNLNLGSDVPTIAQTRISNNMMTFYDANGSQIGQQTIDDNALSIGSLSDIISLGDKNALLEAVNAASSAGFTQTQGANKGIVVLSNGQSETTIDMDNGLLLGTKTLDSNGQVATESTMNATRDEQGGFILLNTFEKSYEQLPNSGAKAVTTVSSKYNSFKLTSN